MAHAILSLDFIESFIERILGTKNNELLNTIPKGRNFNYRRSSQIATYTKTIEQIDDNPLAC